MEFTTDQATHGESAELFGASGYVWSWLQSTFENWQSEFLQLFTMVVLSTFLIHKGSQQSRDSQEELRMAILRIEEQLEELADSRASAGSSKA